ncbi:MAG TPA: site-specific integrase [Euzebya sp.]|nr:site-specific integrase [Euzebya sp.]
MLTAAPIAPPPPAGRHPARHEIGLGLVLDWLEDQPGATWQDRWLASGADTGDERWRHIPIGWLHDRGRDTRWSHDVFFRALALMISADLIRPSVRWLVTTSFRSLVADIVRHRDPEGFERLRTLVMADPDVSRAAANRTMWRSALILAAKGGTLGDIVTGDVVELLDTEADARSSTIGATNLLYRTLHALGGLEAGAPATLRQLRSAGPRSCEELIDRHHLECRPVRDLLVDYLRERQPALDYTSLNSLANFLGGLFWADLERHHPGIDSLHLPPEVADAWKQRLRTITTTSRTPEGHQGQATTTARINYRECLTPVRAFYLDLAHWAVEDPSRWAAWVVPCPVGREEISRRKDKRHRKARMDARTRQRLPLLPTLVRSVNQRRIAATALLDAAASTPPGETFTAAGQTLRRATTARSAPTKIWAEDPHGTRRDLGREEEQAFWAFAAVEVLRATGIRIEELTELTHHSLVQYRLPTTGELVPLLQITPSKTDVERLLVISPDLADVLATIISRLRDPAGAIPLVAAYDARERTWSPPKPLLFQRRMRHEHRAISASSIRDMLADALAHTGLTDDTTGAALRFTPHDFRRLFITDAVLNGLPPHIAQIIAGHHDINVTLGYKAIYPEEAIQAHLAFLARRRALRPSEEYRVPTDEEWTEFLGHFERRKVSTGTCGRAFGTPCIHEHACVRCPMLWPDPAQRDRIIEIRDNLQARIAEAEREGWLGEVEGLHVSLTGAQAKLDQIDQQQQHPSSRTPLPLIT